MLKYMFFAGALFLGNAYSQTVSNLQGTYKYGQVFLTWNEISNSAALYKVYRSTSPITTGSQLATSEYLGYTNAESSVNHCYSNHENETKYLRIDSGGSALSSGTGLFVATTLVNGSYYYAVTVLLNNVEDQTITPGSNALSSLIAETVAKPRPIFQKQITIGPFPIDIYTTFLSSKFAVDQPLLNNVGFVPMDFALNRNNATGNNPIRFFFHGGGATYIENMEVVDGNEVRINIEDEYGYTDITSGWWGANQNYDLYNNANNTPPTLGTNFNMAQQRIGMVIDWAINNLPIDSNRIYVNATSDGSSPAFFYALTYPERLAAVEVHAGSFNFGFLNDWQSNCSLNTGKKNRKKGDNRLGTVANNLPSNLGIRTYEALNGGWIIDKYPTRDYPFIYSVNGKYDDMTGWTEKTIFYDSLNNNPIGGYYFWDNRDHGSNTGVTWGDDNFDLYRYKRNLSFPAFSNYNLNEDFGDGNGLNGELFGSVNGSLNWSDNIVDDAQNWVVKIFNRNLIDFYGNTVAYPDSGVADVTPRRLQNFNVPIGATVYWNVKHNSQVIQSGSLEYNGGFLTIPQVKIFKDTSTLTLTISGMQTFYLDADNDGYGTPVTFVTSSSQPAGYVYNDLDCNDSNNQVSPASTDLCNGIDDNCDGVLDDNAISVSISASGSTTVCSPATVLLTPTVTGSATTYQWLKSNVAINGAYSNFYKANSSGSYKLTVSNGICSATSSSISVTVNTTPTATISPSGSYTQCKGSPVVLTTGIGQGWTYQWLKSGSAISGATNSTYSTGNNEGGNFSVKVTASGGCSATSSTTNVTRLAQPTATVTPLGNLDICGTGQVTLQANSGTGYIYQWQKKSVNISGATNQTYTATKKAKYTVIVTNPSGCSKTSANVSVTSSCKMDVNSEDQNIPELIIYPVPNDGSFEVRLSNFTDVGQATLSIFDVSGRMLHEEQVVITGDEFRYEINLSALLNAGVYFVRFSSDNQRHTQMISVSK